MQTQPEKLEKKDQVQTLLNILGALEGLRILGADALMVVQIKSGLEVVIKSINSELTEKP